MLVLRRRRGRVCWGCRQLGFPWHTRRCSCVGRTAV